MRFIQHTLTVVAAAVLLFAGTARSQTVSRIIQVEIPFEFQLGNHVLPAGKYTISQANPSVLLLRDARDRVVASVVASQAQRLTPPPEPKLQFYVEDGRNVLARVWNSNDRYGWELPVAKRGASFAKARTTEVTGASGR